MEEFASALVGGVVVVVAQLGYKWFIVDSPRRRLEEKQKALLQKMLDPENMPVRKNAKRAEWRSLSVLADVIGADEVTAKRLLIEIGARRSTGKEDVWALIRYKPLDKADIIEGQE
jgi:hypothetical protein